jgi:hypothetical protein
MDKWSEHDYITMRMKNPYVLLELCPIGNNRDIIIIILVHDNVYVPC